jgi:hypothetical protein
MKDIKITNPMFSMSFWAAMSIVVSILPFVISYYIRESNYEWIVTAISWEIALWSLVGSIAYCRSKSFYLIVNRIFAFFRHSHSYWLPSFRFNIPDVLPETKNSVFLKNLLDDIQNEKIAAHFKSVNLINQQKAEIVLEKDERYVFEFDNTSLFVYSDRVITTPSGLYEKKSRFLADFAEKIRASINASSITSEIQIQFEDKKNPYYGFFINTLPSDLLDSFGVSFRTDTESECLIIANESGITIKGKNLLHTFSALKNVLSLRPITASL